MRRALERFGGSIKKLNRSRPAVESYELEQMSPDGIILLQSFAPLTTGKLSGVVRDRIMDACLYGSAGAI